MKVLVTGGAGFIGSHLIDALLKEDFQIVCVDNFDNYSSDEKVLNIQEHLKSLQYELVRGDIGDPEFVEEVFKIFKPKIVINLAARSGVSPSFDAPEEYFGTNVTGIINLLNSIKNYPVLKFIQASSNAVYSKKGKTIFSETDCTAEPISMYAATKISAEAFCHAFCKKNNINTSVLRFFPVYGSRIRPDLAIRKFTLNILQNKEIHILGTGDSCQDYTHVSDIVAGIRKSMDYTNEKYSIFNLGSSIPTKQSDLIAKIETIANKKALIRYSETPQCKPYTAYADISKAKQLLNYNPVKSLDEGLTEMIVWIKKNKIS